MAKAKAPADPGALITGPADQSPEQRADAAARAHRVVAAELLHHWNLTDEEAYAGARCVLLALGVADFRMVSKPIVEAYTHHVGPTPNCGHCVQLQTELDLARKALRHQEVERWQAVNDLEGLRQRLEKLTDSVKWERYSSKGG